MLKLKFAVIVLFILLWHLSVGFDFFNKGVMPFPEQVFGAFISLSQNGLAKDVLDSSYRVLVGFSIASIAGISFGLLLAYYKPVEISLSPLIEIIRPIPPIAWIPLAILWFGIGNLSSFFLIALGAFFPILSSTYDGVKNISKSLVFTAKTFGARDSRIFMDIVLPCALPSIMTGLEIGLGVAWMILIAAELVGATSGLGYMIQLNRVTLQTANIIVGMISIGIAGFAMQKFLKSAEKFLIPWKIKQLG